jgi:hypothetical protein
MKQIRHRIREIWDEVKLLSSQSPPLHEIQKPAQAVSNLVGMYVFMRVVPQEEGASFPLKNQYRQPVLNVEFNFITNAGNITSKTGTMTHDDIGRVIAGTGKLGGPSSVYLPHPGAPGFTSDDLEKIMNAAQKISGKSGLSPLVRYSNSFEMS